MSNCQVRNCNNKLIQFDKQWDPVNVAETGTEENIRLKAVDRVNRSTVDEPIIRCHEAMKIEQ